MTTNTIKHIDESHVKTIRLKLYDQCIKVSRRKKQHLQMDMEFQRKMETKLSGNVTNKKQYQR